MRVPVEIDFGNNRYALLRVTVTGADSQFELPLMPAEPKELLFNVFESVLHEVKNEKWHDQ